MGTRVCAYAISAMVSALAPHASAQTLQPGWTIADVGKPRTAGTASFGPEAISITSTGADVAGVTDQFTFVYRPIRGNATVVAVLDSVTNGGPDALAGVMIREALDPRARHAFLFGRATGDVGLRTRAEPGGRTRAVAGGSGSRVWLKLERRGSLLTASRSADGSRWTRVGTATVAMATQVLVGLAAASGSDSARVVARLSKVMVVGNGKLDAGFAAADVGRPLVAGGSWLSGGTAILDGAGSGIRGASDQFRYVYRSVSGDMDVVTRVVAVDSRAPAAQAGIMIRQNRAAGSANVSLVVSRQGEISFTGRLLKDGATITRTKAAASVPRWLKLTRRGATLTALRSSDGIDWTTIGRLTLTLTEPVLAGLAVSSSDPSRLARATFAGVSVGAARAAQSGSVVGNSPPVVSLTGPVNSAVFAAPASIAFSATASDPGGSVSVVEFYAGTTLVGSDTTSPYSFTWRNVPAGNYAVIAVARDHLGGMTVSGGRDIRVVAPSVHRAAIFEPSSVHAVVERYVLEIFLAESNPDLALPLAVQDLGRPPVVDNECTVDVSAVVFALPPGRYVATVSAVTWAGLYRSSVSPEFTR